jgi:hypothetical protein
MVIKINSTNSNVAKPTIGKISDEHIVTKGEGAFAFFDNLADKIAKKTKKVADEYLPIKNQSQDQEYVSDDDIDDYTQNWFDDEEAVEVLQPAKPKFQLNLPSLNQKQVACLVVSILVLGLVGNQLMVRPETTEQIANRKAITDRRLILSTNIDNLEKQILEAKAEKICLEKAKVATECSNVEAVIK